MELQNAQQKQRVKPMAHSGNTWESTTKDIILLTFIHGWILFFSSKKTNGAELQLQTQPVACTFNSACSFSCYCRAKRHIMKAQCCLVPRIGTEALEAWLGDVEVVVTVVCQVLGFQDVSYVFQLGFHDFWLYDLKIQ